ncbi:uncharacterized protein LOC133541877 isoform X3 [Nerophis ophidion]|uniref:uncharacterized protein LOC133541877 isoform X3 n=1 Tax=Nerophis ophidion TaxID=159077 RepID=UPI002AE03564|nr:uncharacterized protein LOC133541877 isoform X3 [Nerophis ophidion]
MMKHLRVHGVQINACPVFDALRRPSSVSSSGSGSDAQSGTSVNALQSESDNLQPASQAPRCAQRTPFTITAMGKMSVPQTEECHGKGYGENSQPKIHTTFQGLPGKHIDPGMV